MTLLMYIYYMYVSSPSFKLAICPLLVAVGLSCFLRDFMALS